MRSWNLERKLVVGVLALFLVPTVVAGAVLWVLWGQGALESPSVLATTVLVGFVTMMAYLGLMARSIGQALVRTIQEIQLGTELMATVNPSHRLAVHTGDELAALAGEVNRMADRMQEARSGLEREVARATGELTLERSRLSAVLEALGEGVVVATADGRVSLANRAAAELLGAGGASLLGRSLAEIVDREKLAHFAARLSAPGGGVERFSLQPPSGAVLEAVMTAVGDGAEGPVGLVLIVRDVTRPALTDAERQERLAETLRALRGPLASVRSLSESLLDDPAPGGPGGRPLLEAIHREALRLSGLVREMSAPGHLGVARPPRHFEVMALADLAAMARRRLRADGREEAAVETAERVAGLPPVRAETSALSGALAILLRALLADGGRRGTVSLDGARRGRLVQIEVAAPGGADAARLEARLDAGVRETVKRHAGEVWAFAEGDRFGFRLTLPEAEAEAAAAAGGPVWTARFRGAGTSAGPGASGAAGDTARTELYDFSLLEAAERQLRPGDRDRPLDALTYVVLDTETTGLRPDGGDRVVSLAGVRVRGGAVRPGEVFDALVNPGRPIPPASVRFHGITDEAVAGAPPVDVVLPAFLRFAEEAVLVGHEVSFDLRFLGREAERLGLPALTAAHPVLDTLALSEAVHGPLPVHDLDAVAGRLGVAVRGRHSALGDALTTAEVLVRLLELLRKRGVLTLGQAMDAARRARRAARDPAAGEGP